jgi:hypothetical protein
MLVAEKESQERTCESRGAARYGAAAQKIRRERMD